MLEEEARKSTKAALDALLHVLKSDYEAAETRVAAAREILARAWGPLPKD
jgi:hypothetical protein